MKPYLKFAFLICILGTQTLVSCKSKAVVAEAKAGGKITADTIIKKHYANRKDFSTLYVKANAKYEDSKQSQKVTAEIRIKKNEKILISIRFIGITLAKALITPTEVKYYEKINSNYFEGDYTLLSRWLGTDLDFNKVQNLLLGQAIDDLSKENYLATIEDNLYKLENSDSNTTKAFYFESGKFLLKKQQVTQKAKDRMIQILYPNFTDYNPISLPTNIEIEAAQQKGKVNFSIEYNSVSFNEDLSFPYSVPEGYERIFIN